MECQGLLANVRVAFKLNKVSSQTLDGSLSLQAYIPACDDCTWVIFKSPLGINISKFLRTKIKLYERETLYHVTIVLKGGKLYNSQFEVLVLACNLLFYQSWDRLDFETHVKIKGQSWALES